MAASRLVEDPRAQLHGMWAAVSGSWAAQAEFVDARHAATTDRMLQSTMPRPGERVLELACGPGGVGLAAAARVAPGAAARSSCLTWPPR